MDNFSKKDRFNKVFNHLKSTGKIHTQVEFAKIVGSSEATISKALKGDEKSLTDSLLKRVNKAFGNIFSMDWLLNGIGSMCCQPSSDINTLFNAQGDNSTNQQIVGASNEALIKENEMLKQLLEEKERMIQVLLKK